jgi:hypothetical protein
MRRWRRSRVQLGGGWGHDLVGNCRVPPSHAGAAGDQWAVAPVTNRSCGGAGDFIPDAFKNAEQVDRQDSTKKGWGQFLDVPREHNQIGSYGTAAGCIVAALAVRKRKARRSVCVRRLAESPTFLLVSHLSESTARLACDI